MREVGVEGRKTITNATKHTRGAYKLPYKYSEVIRLLYYLPMEMRFKELKEKFNKAETETERNELIDEYWNSHAWVRFWTYSFILIISLLILGVGIGLFIRLVRFIAF